MTYVQILDLEEKLSHLIRWFQSLTMSTSEEILTHRISTHTCTNACGHEDESLPQQEMLHQLFKSNEDISGKGREIFLLFVLHKHF